MEPAPDSKRQPLILVVDDSETYLQAVCEELAGEGYQPLLARSGEEALATLAGEPVDCILLDLRMPGLSGEEICQRIKASPAWRGIPVILMTALDETEAMAGGFNAGADDFVTKSASLQVLKVRVRAQLRRRRFEAENRRFREELLQQESARLVAEKASLAKSEFLSAMSHGLRTPMNAILGFAQLMDTELPPPRPSQKASIDQILRAGWHLLELIDEILDLSAVESGKLSLVEEPVELLEVLSECHALVEQQAQERGIKLTFPRLELPRAILADRTRLKQVLVNLLSNAIKYNRPGGSVAVECSAAGQRPTRISVQDTGAGMSAAQLAQLFQPFNRLGRERGEEEGTGIGLVMSRRLVELMRGAIGVESTVGVGSRFWFELP